MSADAATQAKPDLLLCGRDKPTITAELGKTFVLHKAGSQPVDPEVVARIRGMAVTGLVPVDRAMLSKFPRLEIVSTFGVGYDHIDIDYAKSHNIIVTNTPDVLTEETADTAIGLLIATVRELVKADRYIRSGQWTRQPYPLSVGSLRDRTVGIVGLGRIGQAIARRLDAMRVPVVYHARHRAEGVSYRYYPSLIEMAHDVDTMIVVIPGGAATEKLIDARVLQALGSRGIFINLARGSVVDEDALIDALQRGVIMNAGLDVFANEPVVPDALIDMPNTVLLPHIGSASVQTRHAMDMLVIDNIKAWFSGQRPLTPVPETPVKER
jgi:lactate dehydrogenase-like 2-hydroxyacid dehydrogenase